MRAAAFYPALMSFLLSLALLGIEFGFMVFGCAFNLRLFVLMRAAFTILFLPHRAEVLLDFAVVLKIGFQAPPKISNLFA
jgi:hypothetical protein